MWADEICAGADGIATCSVSPLSSYQMLILIICNTAEIKKAPWLGATGMNNLLKFKEVKLHGTARAR